MNKTKIEWTDYSWNPVVGCKHNCWYCYAKRIAKRFYKDNPNFEPRFHPERLTEPYKLKKPSKIFVCSMADLFGDWVPDIWIEAVLTTILENPQHTFQLLTKNPKRYLEFASLRDKNYIFFLKNCWTGITIDYPNKAQEKIDLLKQLPTYKFISFEPLLGDMSGLDLSGIDLVIVGKMTGMGKKNIIPKREWIKSIKHPNIFYKGCFSNLGGKDVKTSS